MLFSVFGVALPSLFDSSYPDTWPRRTGQTEEDSKKTAAGKGVLGARFWSFVGKSPSFLDALGLCQAIQFELFRVAIAITEAIQTPAKVTAARATKRG